MPNAQDVLDFDSRAVSPRLSDELKDMGFDPGIPVFRLDRVSFGVDDIKQALFHSTYKRPCVLPFHEVESVSFEMVVETVQTLYFPREGGVDEPIDCYEDPEYYIKGFVFKSGFGRVPEPIQVHVYIQVGRQNEFHGAFVQLVRKPSGADPSTPLRYGDD